MKSKYNILKVLNNNSLLITDGKHESIIIGKGIGFKRKPDEKIDKDILVEKEYHLLSDHDYDVHSQNPKEIIINTAHIVDIVDDNIDGEIPEQSIRSLSNHVAAMLVRLENNEIFPNPFHHETVTLYGDSYTVALKVATQVEARINIVLPESEIDFLALYIYGIISNYDQQDLNLRNAIISEVSETIEDDLNINLNKSSVAYARFITHLKFLIERLTRVEEVKSVPMVASLAEQYPEYMEMSEVIIEVLERQLNQTLTLDEQTYIALHLARLTMNDGLVERKVNVKESESLT